MIGGPGRSGLQAISQTETALHPGPDMNLAALRLAGQRALMTGASRGIGAAIAPKLAEDGAGVAITYETSEKGRGPRH